MVIRNFKIASALAVVPYSLKLFLNCLENSLVKSELKAFFETRDLGH